MTDRNLPTLLRELQDALSENETLDETTRALVEDVRVDLDRALEGDADANGSLGERLRGALHHFEKQHPSLVAVTQRVLNQLADLGV